MTDPTRGITKVGANKENHKQNQEAVTIIGLQEAKERRHNNGKDGQREIVKESSFFPPGNHFRCAWFGRRQEPEKNLER